MTLCDIAAEHGFHYLPGSPLITEEVGFTGSLGWYDYSLRDPRLDGSIGNREYAEGTFRDSDGRTMGWNDTWKAAWLRNLNSEDWRQRRSRLANGEVLDRVAATLHQDLEQIAGRVTKLKSWQSSIQIPLGAASPRRISRISLMRLKGVRGWAS
jgi:hypothetical protein